MKRSSQSVANVPRRQVENNFLPEEIQELIVRTRRITDDRILRLPQVREKVGRANATIWQDVSEGSLPPPISIGPRAVGWKSSELDAWIAAQEFASRNKATVDMKTFVAQLIAPVASSVGSAMPSQARQQSNAR